MADSEENMRKLPPISPRSKSESAIKRKKTKPMSADSTTTLVVDYSEIPKRNSRPKTHESESKIESDNDKPARRKKKKSPTTESSLVGEPEADFVTRDTESEVIITKKKKKPHLQDVTVVSEDANETEKTTKRKKKKTPVTDSAQHEEVTSKTDHEQLSQSVLYKKPRKTKRKTVTSKDCTNDEDYPDSGFAADLTSIEDDVLDDDSREEQTETNIQIQETAAAATILKSVPTSKLFIETDTGFKGEKKSQVAKRFAEDKPDEMVEQEMKKYTTLDFALSVQRVMLTASLFLHGLTAGIALWHIVIVYILSANKTNDLLQLYQPLAQPVQCLFYLLFTLCTVSAMDRSDVAHRTRRFFIRAITLQSGATAVIMYFVALVLSVSIVGIEDQLNLWTLYKNDWLLNGTKIQYTPDFAYNIQIWKNMNTARCVAAMLGWLILAMVPKVDKFAKNLNAEDSIIHGVDILPTSKA